MRRAPVTGKGASPDRDASRGRMPPSSVLAVLSCLPRGLRPADPVFTPAAGPPRQVPGRPRASLLLWSALIALAFPLAGRADPDDTGLADLSLEELAMVEVTSVSKREQTVANAPAAVFVITQEDIQRSGARNVSQKFVARYCLISPASCANSCASGFT